MNSSDSHGRADRDVGRLGFLGLWQRNRHHAILMRRRNLAAIHIRRQHQAAAERADRTLAVPILLLLRQRCAL